MIEVNWRQDYKKEFICPSCDQKGLRLKGKTRDNKQKFYCFYCSQQYFDSCHLRTKTYEDINLGTTWHTGYRIDGFICPECQSENMYFAYCEKPTNKKQFRCRSCGRSCSESINLNLKTISRLSQNIPILKEFCFEDDRWDLRLLNPNFNKRNRFFISFDNFKNDWFKLEVKQYILYLCKLNKPFATIHGYLDSFKVFSYYLSSRKIDTVSSINRTVILDFILTSQTGNHGLRKQLGALRDFFRTGNIHGWFEVNQDIIRDDDYPAINRGNPDPISDRVREQIEENLYKLPEPLARMWIVAFFTAMRPSELAFLKKDCLIQEGNYWKIIWQRSKTNDYHEVPITRTIAKVVQEQQEYIENLWKTEWNYLFCHYHGFSKTDLLHPKLQPVKKVISQNHNTLQRAICCLIKACDIRDDNGKLAEFSSSLVRPTRLTQLFEQGHDLAVVSAWAGHKHLVTTSTYYTYVSCELIEKEAGHIQKALFNVDGKPLYYESMPKSFWEHPTAHQLELAGNHINTPIYGYCGLSLSEKCDRFRACYTCIHFVATIEKLPQYIKVRDELRGKASSALANGHDVLVEQFGRQADQLDKIIASLQEAA